VVHAGQRVRQQLLRGEEVPNVAPRKASAACVAAAIRLYRPRIVFVLQSRNREPTVRGVELTMAAKSCRCHAVELVDTTLDAREQVLRLADAEQMPWPVPWQVRERPIEHSVHIGL